MWKIGLLPENIENNKEANKVCLTQRGILPLKDNNMIAYLDGVGYRL